MPSDIYEDIEERKSPYKDILRNINTPMIGFLFLALAVLLGFYFKNAYLSIGLVFIAIILIAMSKKESDEEYMSLTEARDLMMIQLVDEQKRKDAYPNGLPEGDVEPYSGADPQYNPFDASKILFYKIGFRIILKSGLPHYFLGKVHPLKPPKGPGLIGIEDREGKGPYFGDEPYVFKEPYYLTDADKVEKYIKRK